MRYIDISRTINSRMKKYPTDPAVRIIQFKSRKKGDSCNLKKLSFGSHVGTHIDAPRHIFDKARTIDKIRLKDLICDVFVVDINKFSKERFIKEKHSRNLVKGILFKGERRNDSLTINDVKLLLKNKIRVFGTEQMSIDDYTDKSHPFHQLMLSRNCVIIEALDLEKVMPGYYKLICLPLKIKNGDGAPARAVLIDD